MTKLRIDLFSGTLEVDGDEEFVRSVYGDFKDQLLAIQKRQGSTPVPPKAAGTPVTTTAAPAPAGKETRQPARRRARISLSLVKELDLTDIANDFSLQDFYAAKGPQTAMESNVVFVYYLQQIAGVERIGVNHIYTCYKHMGIKYPNALKQSLADTSSRKNWLNTSSFEDIRLDTAGENYVEHDLPRVG